MHWVESSGISRACVVCLLLSPKAPKGSQQSHKRSLCEEGHAASAGAPARCRICTWRPDNRKQARWCVHGSVEAAPWGFEINQYLTGLWPTSGRLTPLWGLHPNSQWEASKRQQPNCNEMILLHRLYMQS